MNVKKDKKKNKNKKQLCLNALLKEPIWCNKMFVYKSKPIFFQNWLKRGFKYLYDFVDRNGIKPLEWFSEKLTNKNNWLCEYMIIKTITLIKIMNFQIYDMKMFFMKSFHMNYTVNNTCCDTRPRFFRSHAEDCPIQSPLTTRMGMRRIYSNPDPRGSDHLRCSQHCQNTIYKLQINLKHFYVNRGKPGF
jgi:hypothetical protein